MMSSFWGIVILQFLPLFCLAQDKMYFFNKNMNRVFIIDTNKLEFAHRASGINGGVCGGHIVKKKGGEYLLMPQYNLRKLPLKITWTDCNNFSVDKTITFDFENDPNISEVIAELTEPVDSQAVVSFYKDANYGVTDSEVKYFLYKINEERPAFRVLINDSLRVKIFHKQVKYTGSLRSLQVYSQGLKVKSDRYLLNDSCSSFNIKLKLIDDFLFYCNMTSDKIILKSNKKLAYYHSSDKHAQIFYRVNRKTISNKISEQD